MRYLLDTDTCIDVLRGLPAVVRRLAALAPNDCAISAITSFELFAGAANARDPRREIMKVHKFMELIETFPFAADAAERAGALRIQLERAGRSIGPYDLLIAAHALTLELTLVSANSRDFARIHGLTLENWRQ